MKGDRDMQDFICFDLMKEYSDSIENFRCDGCGPSIQDLNDFKNSDTVLLDALQMVKDHRKEFGLEGLVKGLQAVIINTEEHNFVPAVKELLDFTGLKLDSSFSNQQYMQAVLKVEDSADFIVRHAKRNDNPFRPYNIGPKSKHLPDTRLETTVFEITDIDRYHEVQKERGVNFIQNEPIVKDNYSFIQTIPSSFTGNSIGFIQWHGKKGDHRSEGDIDLVLDLEKPQKDHLKNVKYLDHSATRLESQNRDAAIIEFMELTNYNFDFAIYVKNFNSITNVARLSRDDYAQVFTTGIKPFTTLESSGPTEKYVHNYGPRVHHLAFHTERIEDTFEALKQDGMEFLLELVGSPDEGLKQTFTKGMRSTLLVNEYIHRYGDFDGFFTRSNVTDLTVATDAQ